MLITTPDPSNGTVATCRTSQQQLAREQEESQVMMMGMRGFDTAKLAKGAARRLTEYFLILSLGKSEFHHFNACSFPPSTQEGVLIAT